MKLFVKTASFIFSLLLLFLFSSVINKSLAVDSSGVWQQIASMPSIRSVHGSALLPDGRVLTAGGLSNDAVVNSSEIYNPANDTWTPTGSLNVGRALPVSPYMINLADGRILVASGQGASGEPLSSTEIYDPNTGVWSFAANSNVARYRAVLAPLPNNKVLLATGNTGGSIIQSAEIYDPSSNSWSFTGSVNIGRDEVPSVAVLNDGRVMIAGGNPGGNTAEVYDPQTGIWTLSTMPLSMNGGSLTVLGNGKVLGIGGSSVALYDPSLNTWSSLSSLSAPKYYHGAILLSDGKVLAFGGNNGSVRVSNSEIYDPSTNTWTAGPSLPSAYDTIIGVKLPSGDFLVAGGGGVGSEVPQSASAFLFTNPSQQLTSLAPGKVWVGLKNSDDVGVKFDLKAEAYLNGNLVSSGEATSLHAGSSGFNNAKLNTINFNSFSSVNAPSGSTLTFKLYVRNACTGSGHNSGVARLWYNDAQANSRFGTTIASNINDWYLVTGFGLSVNPGAGPKKTIDVQSGAKCSAYKLFGSWVTTTP